MKRFLYLLLISISFFACKPGIPEDIIQPTQMQDVLVDIHIVDGYISTLPGADTAKKVGSAYYKGIYKKFNIDSAIYNKSMNYYYKHPDLMKQMYDTITAKLTLLKDKSPVILNDEAGKFIFKGIFDKNAKDSTIYDFNLNRKYNNRLLKTNVFVNITNPQALLPLNVMPIAQPIATPVPQPSTAPRQPEAVVQPTQELPKLQQ